MVATWLCKDRRGLWLALSAAAASIVAAAVARRRSRSARELSYVFVDASVHENHGGRLVVIQRHGRSSKNVLMKPTKNELKRQLAAHIAAGGALESPPAAAIFARWREYVNEERWFDDSLDAVGTDESIAAGREFARWRRSLWLGSPTLLITSPFRRAIQTQQLSARAAGLETVALLGEAEGARWVARDDLRETPYSEASCRRHATSALAKWMPLLDVSHLAENTECESVTALEAASGDDLRPVVAREARTFLAWLDALPSSHDFVWVTTHQGPAKTIIELCTSAARDYRSNLANAEMVVFRRPAASV